jgi:cytidylate kinase
LKPLIIAIDGPAASGKSTTARRVAARLGYVYVDTGAMYRAITLGVLRAGIAPEDERSVVELGSRLDISLKTDADGFRVFLGDEDVSTEIRQPNVTEAVSAISAYPAVRERMVAMQRRIGAPGGIVMDGRDIGTVVFPNADLKIFLVASIVARAARRADEVPEADLSEIERDLSRRDALDSSRAESPLRRAPDAVAIDTTELTIDEQVQRVVELARARIAPRAQ